MQQDLSNLTKHKQHPSLFPSSSSYSSSSSLMELFIWVTVSPQRRPQLSHYASDMNSCITVLMPHAHTHHWWEGNRHGGSRHTHQPANEIMETQTWMIWQKLTYFMVFEYGNLKRGEIERKGGRRLFCASGNAGAEQTIVGFHFTAR